MATLTPHLPRQPAAEAVPPLQPGDRLSREEFERRYDATPGLKKAELIEGKVYMPPPVSHGYHGLPHSNLITWLGLYRAATPGVSGGDNSSLRLDLDNMPQPDAYLLVDPQCGGQARISEDGYIEGAPELIAEVAATSASYDLHDKLHVYRRNGVREYIVWRTFDRAIDYFILRQTQYVPHAAGSDEIHRSEVFPGLWLNTRALLSGELQRALEVLQLGLSSAEHEQFAGRLRERAGGQ